MTTSGGGLKKSDISEQQGINSVCFRNSEKFCILYTIAAFGYMCPLSRKRYRYNTIRYAGRDYFRAGKYFVTICTAGASHATPLLPRDTTYTANETMSSISPKPGSLSVVVRSYKSVVTKHAHKFDSHFSWQRGFYDNIICASGQLSRIRKYISENVQNRDKNGNQTG